jgi:endonuclease/exonuclease/phosphatase family metal-dependent hydrolase
MSIVRVATYNIHKGVQGLGPVRRLEIHNLAHAVEQFDADIVCLQEVRSHHRKFERYFTRWPELDQAGYLSPEGYEAVYRTNAVTRHGEHGNALLSRWPVLGVGHADVSDHRFEQRGLLHAQLLVDGTDVHVVVVHLGLIHASRERQVQRLGQFITREVPSTAPLIVAGDFNDWSAQLLKPMAALDLRTFEGIRLPTYPARLPLLHLDRIFVRGLRPVSAHVPHGAAWRRMSDHLPLIADLEL